MKKFIDVLQMPILDCPYFTVDTAASSAPVIGGVLSTFQIWTYGTTSYYRQAKFQNRDNIQVLSIGMYIPENFTFTSVIAPLFDNTLALPVGPAIGDTYTAQVTAQGWAAGYIYRWNGTDWINLNGVFPSSYLNLQVTNVEGLPGVSLPGFGSSYTSSFALPFPNYELVLDGLYCDICNIDEGKIRQVIMNFADNALYYSTQGTKITVKLAIEGTNVVFTVKDTGIGVPRSEQAQLFTKFYRASNARKQRPDGTGVGLFLAKKVIDAHGGSVLFESVEGKGSTFGFRVPLEELRASTDTDNLDNQDSQK
jgi:anti-sigma regulatory factor (Ser/Thr protein kinase)